MMSELLEIPVHDAFAMCGFDGLGDLAKERHGLFDGKRALRKTLGQRLPFDKLHDEKPRSVRVLETVERGDVGVVQRREELGFSVEPCEPLFVTGEIAGQDFDGDVTLEFRVDGAIHLAIPPTPTDSAIS